MFSYPCKAVDERQNYVKYNMKITTLKKRNRCSLREGLADRKLYHKMKQYKMNSAPSLILYETRLHLQGCSGVD